MADYRLLNRRIELFEDLNPQSTCILGTVQLKSIYFISSC